MSLLWAILAAVATNMAVGMLWYGPLFGRLWMRAMGMEGLTAEHKKAMQKEATPGYLTSMAGAAVATAILWFLHDWTSAAPEGYSPELKGVVLGFSGWLAFYVAPTLTSRFFEGQKMTVWAIGAGYWGLLLMLYGLYVGIFS